MNWKIFAVIILIVLAIFAGVFLVQKNKILNPTPVTPNTNDTGATTKSIEDVVKANNQFAFDLYSQYKTKEGNIFFSPYSISTALAMTYEGAMGKTAEEMQSVFHFPQDENERRPAFAKIYNILNKEDKKYQLSTANALWAQKDYQFLVDYFNVVDKYYGGKVTNLDFVGDTENSRITINKWVEEQTNDKIKNLLPQGVIDAFTRLVLTNAIYFKGDWVKQFDKGNTREDTFWVGQSNSVKAKMMNLNGEKFNYAEVDNVQILELPYAGEELSMLVILPAAKEQGLSPVEASLDPEKLAEWKDKLVGTEVDVYLPKFKFETKYFMVGDLIKMGMLTAFSDEADFSGMTGKKNLFISHVIHQAFVEVNEEGTEAAAATGVVMTKEISAGPRKTPIFRADHPFIFLIQEKETGSILFIGRVSNPNI